MVDILEQIRANRAKYSELSSRQGQLDEQLSQLVKLALESYSAIEISELLGVSRARVYQIRDGRR